MLVERILVAEELHEEIATLLKNSLIISGFTDQESSTVIITTVIQMLIADMVSPYTPDQQKDLRDIIITKIE